MYCPKCGAKLPDTAKFCRECGAKLSVPTGGSAAERPASVQTFHPAISANAAVGQSTVIPGVPYLTMQNIWYVALGACVASILGFFLPMVSMSYSIGESYIGQPQVSTDASFSGLDMVIGKDILGQQISGDPSNLLYVALPTIALVLLLMLRGKARWIGCCACSALQIMLMLVFSSYLRSEVGSSTGAYQLFSAVLSVDFGPGFVLLVLGGFVMLAASILGLIGHRKGLS